MFAIIRVRDKSNRLRRGRITSERVSLPSGAAFFIVTAEKSFGRIPWKKLEKCLGILKNGVILSDDISVPSDVNITIFTPQIFTRLLLINSATDYILKHRSDFRLGSLTLFDETGLYKDSIEKLLKCFSYIKVVAPKVEEYELLSQRLMADYGFSLLLTDKESYDSDVIISHMCNAPLYFSGKVMTNEKKYLMNAEIFSGTEIELPSLYEKLIPKGVCKLNFAAALYEKCGEKDLGAMIYKDFGC